MYAHNLHSKITHAQFWHVVNQSKIGARQSVLQFQAIGSQARITRNRYPSLSRSLFMAKYQNWKKRTTVHPESITLPENLDQASLELQPDLDSWQTRDSIIYANLVIISDNLQWKHNQAT